MRMTTKASTSDAFDLDAGDANAPAPHAARCVVMQYSTISLVFSIFDSNGTNQILRTLLYLSRSRSLSRDAADVDAAHFAESPAF